MSSDIFYDDYFSDIFYQDYYLPDFLFGLGAALFSLLFILTIIVYVFTAISIQSIAKRNKIPNTWLAWIPLANLYLLSSLVKDKFSIPYFEWILIVGVSVLSIASNNSFVFSILAITLYVLLLAIFHELFKKYSKSYVLLTIFGIILPILLPFFLFTIRNNEPIEQ